MPIFSRSFPVRLLLVLPLAFLALLGCQVKDKPEKSLSSGSMNPPWNAPEFTPKRLDGYKYAGPESLFAVFRDIARLDSVVGDRKDVKIDPKAADTLRVGQLFDTAFVFPQTPQATMPYAYDDSYRDDTLYRNAYGNGLFTQDHPCAVTYVLSDGFMHPAQWLKAGLTQAELVGALGRPAYWQGDTSEAVLRYLSQHMETPPAPADSAVKAADPYPVYEGANFYFTADSLFAAVLQRSQPCH
jgi:hypothetical protein